MFGFVTVIFAALAQDTTYYVATTGSDDASCGAQTSPCATINQVLTNYPGSCTVSIAAGNYTPSPIMIEDYSVIIFQGVGNPTITPSIYDEFVNSDAGFEFHDMGITLTGGGLIDVTTLMDEGEWAGFYNINLTYLDYPDGTFVEMFGGALVISNMTARGARTNGYFVLALSDGDATNITITDSSFSLISFVEGGSLLNFNAYGAANVLLNSSVFEGINSVLGVIEYWIMDLNQTITISNNIFNNINSYDPTVLVEIYKQCVVNIQNTSWNDAYSTSAAGALETIGPNDGSDSNITLNNLKFTNCLGKYVGAILVGYNSLNLSNSIFTDNSGSYGNDVVQGLDYDSSQYTYSITNSTSSSALPKAVIWNTSSDSVTDISSYLPDPSEVEPIRGPTRADVSESPKFGQKIKNKD